MDEDESYCWCDDKLYCDGEDEDEVDYKEGNDESGTSWVWKGIY